MHTAVFSVFTASFIYCYFCIYHFLYNERVQFTVGPGGLMLNRNLISEISNQSKDLRKIFLASSFSYKELFLWFPQHITLSFVAKDQSFCQYSHSLQCLVLDSKSAVPIKQGP